MWRKCKDQLPDDYLPKNTIIIGNNFLPILFYASYDSSSKRWVDQYGTRVNNNLVAWWDADLPSIPDEYY